jgi:curli biogenesis system outer membrane secretion channel CsgG
MLILIIFLSGCASDPAATISMADVTASEQSGTLEGLYARVSEALAVGNVSEDVRVVLEGVKADVAGKLASAAEGGIRQSLEETPRVVEELLPINAIEELRERLTPIRFWSESIHDQLSDELSAEMKRSRTAKIDRQARLAGLSEDDLAQRIILLDELAALAGPGSEDQRALTEQRKSLIGDLNQQAAEAIEAEDYDTAKQKLELVQELDPGDAGTASALVTVNTKLFEKGFWQALEDGDPDAAYAKLTSIANDPSFEFIRPNLASSADVMANYFISLGVAAAKAGNISESYHRFGEAENINSLLGNEASASPTEYGALVSLLEKEYDAASDTGKMGLAWGHLALIHSLQGGDSPALRRRLRETREIVLTRAIKRLTAAPFENSSASDHKFGDAVASKVVQHLFEQIPNDVSIIERERLEDIMREKALGNSSTDPPVSLAAANYLVEGTIQEAKVDSTDKVGKKTMRVVTEQIEKPNPEYSSWIKLDSTSQESTPQPPKTIMSPRKEDVSIEVTLHRKVGLFSVSYRLIDASSARVLFADSVRAKTEHQDTSSEGVELGDFKLEFKLASLPSDVEILAELADEVSAQIGTELAKVLAAPEAGYEAAATRFAEEENFESAAREYAYAIVLSERKGLAVEELMQLLRKSAVDSTTR